MSSMILRSLLRDPFALRPLSRAVRRLDDDLWLDDWPARKVRRLNPEHTESPAVIVEDMNRQMVDAINKMQEFTEDLKSLVGRFDSRDDHENQPRGRKRRFADTLVKRTESGGLQLEMDVGDFKPENLKVKLVDDNLIVEAVNESSAKDTYNRNHFKRWFKLPEDCKVEEIRSKLDNNRLLIDLPSNKPSLEQNARTIPIETGQKQQNGQDNSNDKA